MSTSTATPSDRRLMLRALVDPDLAPRGETLVEPQDQDHLELLRATAQDSMHRASSEHCQCTCTRGPITYVCDGSSK